MWITSSQVIQYLCLNMWTYKSSKGLLRTLAVIARNYVTCAFPWPIVGLVLSPVKNPEGYLIPLTASPNNPISDIGT